MCRLTVLNYSFPWIIFQFSS